MLYNFMNIDIPKHTPLGIPVNTIGVWMSGGADSALLCYLLAKQIKKENLAITIQPITIDYKRPFVFKAGPVREKIEEILDVKHLFEHHIVYNPPGDTLWTPEDLVSQFHIRNYEHFRDNKFQVLYSGITTNPPVDIQKTFKYGVLADVEAKRGADVPKETNRYFVHPDGGEFWEIKPFFELDKKKLAELYKNNNLLDNMFPLTRSCEHVGTVHGHCGYCWWCNEREWAFGRLE
jgi:7-cyano-7-deazaguanine synthase in queuosine biosynthesis